MPGELDLDLDEFEDHEAHRDLAQIPPGTSSVSLHSSTDRSRGAPRLCEYGRLSCSRVV